MEPTQMSPSRICPIHCTTELSQHFNQSNVDITAEGKFKIINPNPAFKVSVLSIQNQKHENREFEQTNLFQNKEKLL